MKCFFYESLKYGEAGRWPRLYTHSQPQATANCAHMFVGEHWLVLREKSQALPILSKLPKLCGLSLFPPQSGLSPTHRVSSHFICWKRITITQYWKSMRVLVCISVCCLCFCSLSLGATSYSFSHLEHLYMSYAQCFLNHNKDRSSKQVIDSVILKFF